MANSRPIGVLGLSWAARQQGEVTAADYALTEYVRLRGYSVRWWWGERKAVTARGAFCYICRLPIVSWDTRYPITREAQAAIAAHRATHVEGGAVTLASRTPAKSAGDDAPPTGETP